MKKVKKKEKVFVFINGRRFILYFGGFYFKVFISLFLGMIDVLMSFCIKRNFEIGGRSFIVNLIIFYEFIW